MQHNDVADFDGESIALSIISSGGEGRALVFEAIDAIVSNELSTATELLDRADSHIANAHREQYSRLISAEARGESVPISLLIIHAMDLVMIAGSERDLARRALVAAETRAIEGRQTGQRRDST